MSKLNYQKENYRRALSKLNQEKRELDWYKPAARRIRRTGRDAYSELLEQKTNRIKALEARVKALESGTATVVVPVEQQSQTSEASEPRELSQDERLVVGFLKTASRFNLSVAKAVSVCIAALRVASEQGDIPTPRPKKPPFKKPHWTAKYRKGFY